MSLPYISHRPPHATWQQWLLAAGLMVAGVVMLRYHLYYLNHLQVRDWGTRYLQVNRNGDFPERLQRMKLVVCALWAAALGFSFYYSKLVLRRQGVAPNAQAMARLAPALVVFLGSVVNYDPPDIDLSLYFFTNSVAFAAIIYGLYRMPYLRIPLMLLGRLAMRAERIPTYALCGGVALFIFLTSVKLGAVLFGHIPLTMDTTAMTVHAKMLLTGRWWIPSHEYKDFFNMNLMVNNGRWYSQYPPGHVILLAIGTFFKSRYFVNPLLGACTALSIFGLAREIYGVRVARYAMVLSGLCVYLIMMSSEFMSHSSALLGATLFVWAFFRLLKKPHWKTGLWGGAAIGFCFIVRPYSALAVSLPYGICALYLLMVQPKRYLHALLAMAGMGLCFVLFQLYFNHATTGDPFVFGYELSWGKWHNPLTQEAVQKLDDTELWKNFRENMQRTAWLNRMVFEWPVPAMILVALLYAWRGGRRDEKLLYLTLAAAFASCQVLPGNVEHEYGPRLVFEILGILVVLCAKALSSLPAFWRVMCRQRRSLAYYYGFAVVLALMFYGFAFAHNVKIPTLANIYNFYNRGNNPRFYKYVVKNVKTPALVFVSGELYQAVSFANPPDNDSPIIFANDYGKDASELIHYYPKRIPYRATASGFHYRVERIRMKP